MTSPIAVVTGGGSGIGRATSICLASRGSAIVVLDIDQGAGARVVSEIGAAGGEAFFELADVTDPENLEKVFGRVAERFGRIDHLVCVAGGATLRPIAEMDAAFVDAELRLNLVSVILCCRHAIATMARQGSGSIVNVSSGWGFRPAPDRAVYAAAKAGIVAFTRSLAAEAGPGGIRANVVAPGPIDTPRMRELTRDDEVSRRAQAAVPLRRLGTPEDVAAAIAFLASDDASYVTGQVVHVNGGIHMP